MPCSRDCMKVFGVSRYNAFSKVPYSHLICSLLYTTWEHLFMYEGKSSQGEQKQLDASPWAGLRNLAKNNGINVLKPPSSMSSGHSKMEVQKQVVLRWGTERMKQKWVRFRIWYCFYPSLCTELKHPEAFLGCRSGRRVWMKWCLWFKVAGCPWCYLLHKTFSKDTRHLPRCPLLSITWECLAGGYPRGEVLKVWGVCEWCVLLKELWSHKRLFFCCGSVLWRFKELWASCYVTLVFTLISSGWLVLCGCGFVHLWWEWWLLLVFVLCVVVI